MRDKSEVLDCFKQYKSYARPTETVHSKGLPLLIIGVVRMAHVPMRPNSKCFAEIATESGCPKILNSTSFKIVSSTSSLLYIPFSRMGWLYSWIAQYLIFQTQWRIIKASRNGSGKKPRPKLYICEIGTLLEHCQPTLLRTIYDMAQLPIYHTCECLEKTSQRSYD